MWTFRAMDTDVAVMAPGLDEDTGEALAREVATIFVDAERRFSRFHADSELSQLNRTHGSVAVSRDMLEVLAAAHRHVRDTAGLFDPAIGAALAAAGYDRTFEEIGALGTPTPTSPPARFADLAIDVASRVVVRPPYIHVDLGGIVKGWTVDRAALRIPTPGFVDAGGDAFLKGEWEVEIEDPFDRTRTVTVIRVRDRAVATSAPNRRRWRTRDGVAHHLIDPRTMRPAVTDLAQATAIAATAEDADVLAKVAFLLGASDGARFLAERGAAGVLIGVDGAVHGVGDVEVV